MSYQSSMKTEMNEKAKLILSELRGVTPTNIHKKTSASESLRDSFHSLWFRHTPSAARYMLLPYLYDGRVTLS